MSDQNLTSDEIINQILGDFSLENTITIKLPSNREVNVRPMSFEDEKSLATYQGKEPTDLLLERCLAVDNVDEFLFADRLYAIYKIREVSYGDTYEFRKKCSKCSNENEYSISINDLPVVYLEEDENNIEVTLPILKKKVNLRLACVRDSEYIKDFNTMASNLWRFVHSVDGFDNKDAISKLIPKMPSGDVKFLLKSVMGLDYGIQDKAILKCNKCNFEEEVKIPINENFFSAS